MRHDVPCKIVCDWTGRFDKLVVDNESCVKVNNTNTCQVLALFSNALAQTSGYGDRAAENPNEPFRSLLRIFVVSVRSSFVRQLVVKALVSPTIPEASERRRPYKKEQGSHSLSSAPVITHTAQDLPVSWTLLCSR